MSSLRSQSVSGTRRPRRPSPLRGSNQARSSKGAWESVRTSERSGRARLGSGSCCRMGAICWAVHGPGRVDYRPGHRMHGLLQAKCRSDRDDGPLRDPGRRRGGSLSDSVSVDRSALPDFGFDGAMLDSVLFDVPAPNDVSRARFRSARSDGARRCRRTLDGMTGSREASDSLAQIRRWATTFRLRRQQDARRPDRGKRSRDRRDCEPGADRGAFAGGDEPDSVRHDPHARRRYLVRRAKRAFQGNGRGLLDSSSRDRSGDPGPQPQGAASRQRPARMSLRRGSPPGRSRPMRLPHRGASRPSARRRRL